MPNATQTRRGAWYGHYKWLAERINGMDLANALRVIHRFMDSNNKYGAQSIADGAERAVEQVIIDLNLDSRAIEDYQKTVTNALKPNPRQVKRQVKQGSLDTLISAANQEPLI